MAKAHIMRRLDSFRGLITPLPLGKQGFLELKHQIRYESDVL